MSLTTNIQWTESTWNPVTGCTKISPGCKNCYAERIALRLKAAKNPSYLNGFNLTLHPNMIDLPLKWIKPRKIFVNSMSDLFHEQVPDSFIFKIFDVACLASSHCFQILTKRSERLVSLNDKLKWGPNIWMGVSVEDEDHVYRIQDLTKTQASIKFISIEPLLGRISNLNLAGIDWVIVGGESGPNSRLMNESWVIDIRNQCQKQGVPFFFKQWGGVNKKKTGRLLDGKIWDEMPNTQKSLSSVEQPRLSNDL